MRKPAALFSHRPLITLLIVFVAIASNVPMSRAQSGWSNASEPDIDGAKKSPKPMPPPPLQVAGSWSGEIIDSILGSGTVTLTLDQKGGSKTKSNLNGTWTITFPPTSPLDLFNDLGSLKGSVTATKVGLTLGPKKGDKLFPCKIVFTSVSASHGSFNGTYHFSSCRQRNSGTISVQSAAQSGNPSVDVQDDVFVPTDIVISKGQTVQWTNSGAAPHTVTSNSSSGICHPDSTEAIKSPTMFPGETFYHTFYGAGTFPYHCELHGCPMKGTITVN